MSKSILRTSTSRKYFVDACSWSADPPAEGYHSGYGGKCGRFGATTMAIGLVKAFNGC